MKEKIDTVIIGGGHAGLTMSYLLSQGGREHVILERGRIGERWLSERWDSFHFQFPTGPLKHPDTNTNAMIQTPSPRVRDRAIPTRLC
jgi:putative flavoprotein involved in K+ transport